MNADLVALGAKPPPPVRQTDARGRGVAWPAGQRHLLIMESHPVQYRVPVYQELERLKPGSFEVVYATDCSARGYQDEGFGTEVKWNLPLLEGYRFRVLGNERGVPLRGHRSLHGRGVFQLLARARPRAVLFTHFAYQFDWTAYLSCLRLGIPIWMRQETQDEAFDRSPVKSFVRRCAYRLIYLPVHHAFYIGRLNHQHLRACGMAEQRLSRSSYCVRDPLAGMSEHMKLELRRSARARYGIAPDTSVLCFSGKLIPKKDPELIFEAVKHLGCPDQKRVHVLVLGSGELMPRLISHARSIPVPATFAGFVNQDELAAHYLAADVLVLPSRRMGETWGLVVNEALHAGCAVAVSDAVGCGAEFGHLERCRVFRATDAQACAQAILELSRLPRNFTWAAEVMRAYSVTVAAKAIADKLP